jgi:hypothetical protein
MQDDEVFMIAKQAGKGDRAAGGNQRFSGTAPFDSANRSCLFNKLIFQVCKFLPSGPTIEFVRH